MMLLLIILLMAVGMVLLFLEVAIIPGFGAAGVSSILCLLAGVVLAWVQYGAAWGVGSLVLAGGMAMGLITLAPRTRAGKELVLSATLTTEPGGGQKARLLGSSGVTLTPLRPSGAAELDGRRVDVVTDGVFVEAGKGLKVVSIEGARVVVEPSDVA
jgi:membrane-bound serine protease (ClpP class)